MALAKGRESNAVFRKDGGQGRVPGPHCGLRLPSDLLKEADKPGEKHCEAVPAGALLGQRRGVFVDLQPSPADLPGGPRCKCHSRQGRLLDKREREEGTKREPDIIEEKQ